MAKKSGAGVHVKAHTRNGKMVRAYTRGGGGSKKSTTGSSAKSSFVKAVIDKVSNSRADRFKSSNSKFYQELQKNPRPKIDLGQKKVDR